MGKRIFGRHNQPQNNFMESLTPMERRSGWIRQGKVRGIHRLYSVSWQKIGDWGEWVALCHVRNLGWDILARNWRSRLGEIDLLAFDVDDLVCLEVKTRRTPSFLSPEGAFTIEKEKRLYRLVEEFAHRYHFSGPIRLDWIAIETKDMRAFQLKHYQGP